LKIHHLHQISPFRGVEVSPLRLDPRPEVILFDLDGTLVETMQIFADVAAEVMVEHYGLVFKNARRLYLQTSGVPFHEQLEVIFGDHENNPAASAEFERRKHAAASAAAMDDATRFALGKLKARGMGLVVSSNGMQSHVDAFAARTPELFDLALGWTEGSHKGEPHVTRVCERLGIRRKALAFVGDSLRDGELAAESRVRFIGRAGTFSREEMSARFPMAPIVDSVAELPAVV
jgi:phosphoglycolate phosphatase-like HAD superfamily hydrolase